MAVYKDPKPTKSGRAWYFKFSYKDAFGATKQYRSKRYLTKKEASDAERMFLVTSTDKVDVKVNIKMHKKLKIKMYKKFTQFCISSDDSELIFNLSFKRYEFPFILII